MSLLAVVDTTAAQRMESNPSGVGMDEQTPFHALFFCKPRHGGYLLSIDIDVRVTAVPKTLNIIMIVR